MPPYELNLVEVSKSGEKVVVYPKEPPAFKPLSTMGPFLRSS